ncbi:hypothetical protein [Streptosporangium sp. NPDC051022]|uniref:hypothetical protein n=1 Tax=Streptosporangium sp. NPDC051022 TaxID=3155752 RepID=UPI00342F792B
MRALGWTLAVAGLALAGCGGAGDPGKAGTAEAGGLRQVMASLDAAGPAAGYLEYGDMAHWRSLGVVTEGGPGKDRRWLSVVTAGFGDLGVNASRLTGPTGVNVFAADRGAVFGVPPKTAIRVEGSLDSADIRAKLTALGAKPREIGGQEGLSLGEDNKIDMTGPQAGLGLMNQLNQVVVTDSALVAGSAAEPVAAGLGAGSSLADSPDHAAVADCLGDVVAAVVTAPAQPGGVILYGVGLRRPASTADKAVDVVCVLPRVAEVGKTFTERFTTAAKVGGRPLGELAETITHDEVRSGDRTVYRAVLTVKPDGPVMLAQQLLVRNELASLADPAAPANPLDVLNRSSPPGTPG